MSQSSIENKTIWITGASSGIGFELAKALIGAKNFVIVSARSEDKLAKLKEINSEKVAIIPLDVTNTDSFNDANKQLKEITDHLDIVIVCAGTCEYDNGPDLNVMMYQRVMQTNFLGAVETLNIALPFLEESEHRPQIVGVSSLSTVAPFPRAEAYGSSKAALEYFLLSLKVDLAPKNIDVSVVRPGFVDTPLTKRNDFSMPFLMSPDDAAAAIVSGVSKRKTVIDFPKKMSLMLRTLNFSSWFWFEMVAPKLRRSDTL